MLLDRPGRYLYIFYGAIGALAVLATWALTRPSVMRYLGITR